jgi:hypothetical protein
VVKSDGRTAPLEGAKSDVRLDNDGSKHWLATAYEKK